MENIIRRDSREIWDILNNNLYGIEDKLIGVVMSLNLDEPGFSYSCRRIESKNKLRYDYRLACSINFNCKLLIRFYYEPVTNKKLVNFFGFSNKRNVQIKDEDDLNKILIDFVENI